MTTTLITGGTGKTGRRGAERLTGLNHPIKIGSPVRAPPVRLERSTWKPALEGCAAAHLAYAPDLAFPGAAEPVDRFARTAVAAGASRLVLLSSRGEQSAQRAEQLVIDSGAEWTVVRCARQSDPVSRTWLYADPGTGSWRADGAASPSPGG